MSRVDDRPFLHEMKARVRQGWFDTLGDAFHRPASEDLWLGVVDTSSLFVYRPDLTFFEGFRFRNMLAAPNRPVDFGSAVPNGLFLLPKPKTEQRGPILFIDARGEGARFGTIKRSEADRLAYGGAPAILDIERLEGAVGQSALLIYNRTRNPEPLFGFLSYEPEQSDTYRWKFIDLCVIYASSQMKRSREEMERMLAIARKAERGEAEPKFDKIVTTLQAKADIYYSLKKLRDLLNLLSYLKYLSVVSPSAALARLHLEGTARQDYERLVTEEIPAFEAALKRADSTLDLDGAVKKIDESLRELRKAAPLLGRLQWGQIRDRSRRQIAQSVSTLLVNELLPDNQEAQEKLANDMDRIRKLLTVIPPRVMGIPRVVGWIEREHKSEIQSNAQYFWTVARLKEQAATFPLVLGAASLLFAFFCPPAAAGLGILSAAISVDDAIFKDAVSDADINVDETFITQAEAREAAIFAAIDIIFAAVDVVEAVKVVRTARNLDRSGAFTDLPDSAGALADLTGVAATGERARDLARYTDAVSPAAVARAVEDADDFAGALASSRTRTTRARAGQLDPSGSNRIRGTPGSAREVIEEASEPRELLRRELPASRADDILRRIDDEYIAHFDDAMQRVADARAAGLADPPGPLTYERFARARWREILSRFESANVDPPRRLRFYETLSARPLDELLGDAAALRAALARRARRTGSHGSKGYDVDFLDDFWKAVHRGEPNKVLDDILERRFLGPTEDLGRRAGLTGAEAREFGFWAHSIDGVRDWDGNSLRALRNLFESVPAHSTDVTRVLGRNRNALIDILNRPSFRNPPGLRTELVKSLDRIKHVDGVFSRSSVFTGLSSDEWVRAMRTRRVPRWSDNLFESLTSNHTRGYAFEAILTARILEAAEASGARVTVGRRFWLNGIEEFNVERRLTSTRPMNNILEADVMIEFPDGRRALIDAKFYRSGFAIDRRVVNQAAKMAEGVDEGIVHSAAFVTSHRVRGLRELKDEAGTVISRLESHADLLQTGDGRVRIFSKAYEDGLPQDFLPTLRSNVVVGPAGEIIERAPPRLRPIGPERLPLPPPEPPLRTVVPARERLVDLVPERAQPDILRAETTLRPDLSATDVPISPVHSAARLVLKVARTASGKEASDIAAAVFLVRINRSSSLGRKLERKFQATHIGTTGFKALETEARAGKICLLDFVGGYDIEQGAFQACDVGRTRPVGEERGYLTFRFAEASESFLAILIPYMGEGQGMQHQCVLLDARGRTLRTFPRTGYVPTRTLAVNVVPISTRLPEGDYSYPFDSGLHRFALRFRVGKRVVGYPAMLGIIFGSDS